MVLIILSVTTEIEKLMQLPPDHILSFFCQELSEGGVAAHHQPGLVRKNDSVRAMLEERFEYFSCVGCHNRVTRRNTTADKENGIPKPKVTLGLKANLHYNLSLRITLK